MLSPTVGGGGIMLSGCLSVRASERESIRQFVNAIFHELVGEFHQIYNFRAPGNTDEVMI